VEVQYENKTKDLDVFKEKDRVAVRQVDGTIRTVYSGTVFSCERGYTVKTRTPLITLYDVPQTYLDSTGTVIRTRNPNWKVGDTLEFRYSHATDLYKYLQKYLADEDAEALRQGLVELQYNGLAGGENALVLSITDALDGENPRATIESLITSYYVTVKT
jgi:hypothetical protein